MTDVSAASEGEHHPLLAQLSALNHARIYVDVAVVIVVLALTNLLAHFTTPWANVAVVPAAAVGLVLLVRHRGLGWTELGLGREHWKSGAGYAAAAIALVGTVIAVGALLPWTRPMFLNNNYATLSGALLASMIIIPLQTVIPEELAFRGVLHGALDRAWGWRGVAAAGSLLFGLWHIATSMGLTASNVGFTKILGGGIFGMVAGVVGAVHAGRVGAAQGVVPEALRVMVDAGARAEDVSVLLGPAVSGPNYEVPDEMAAEVERSLPGSRTTTRRGTAGLDLRAGIAAQLRSLGVTAIDIDPRCTVDDPTLFSHRRDAPTGRLASLVWLEPQR